MVAFDFDGIFEKRALNQLYPWLQIVERDKVKEGRNGIKSSIMQHTLRQTLIDAELVSEDSSFSIEIPSDVKSFPTRIVNIQLKRQN